MYKTTIYPSLKNKVVLISGGASGIGESIVEKFLEQGSKVAFLDNKEELGKSLSKKLNNFKYSALFKKCELTDIVSIQNRIKEIKSELGKISILVNSIMNLLPILLLEILPFNNVKHLFT